MIKILFVHSTRIGSVSATGQLIQSLLEDVKGDLDVYDFSFDIDGKGPCEQFIDAGKYYKHGIWQHESISQLFDEISPDVIVFRPDSRNIDISNCVIDATKGRDIILVSSFMDVWENELHRHSLENLIFNSDRAWFISESIKENYLEKYPFKGIAYVVANGVEPHVFRFPKIYGRDKRKLKVVFTGSINLHQTYEGLELLASAIHNRPNKICFDIYSRQWNTELAKSLSKYSGVTLHPPKDKSSDYFQLIKKSDVLAIPYGWNEQVISYLKYSFGNKIPEFLACGVPVIVLGSDMLNSVRYLKTVSGVKVISTPELHLAKENLEGYLDFLCENYDKCLSEAQSSRHYVLKEFSIYTQRSVFINKIIASK